MEEDRKKNESTGARERPPSVGTDCVDTGITGLDEILCGGLPGKHAYLVQGHFGTGKTTLALQFCRAGARRGERVLYMTTNETEEEVREVARCHGWSLEGVKLHYLDVRKIFGEQFQQSVFHPVEVELPETMGRIFSLIEQFKPHRLVIDALSEIRLLAVDARWLRNQILRLKDFLRSFGSTTLFCDEQSEPGRPVQSIVHGVIELEQYPATYGPDRRRMRVAKLRGKEYSSGYHDFKICKGGLDVYPRLVAAEHRHLVTNTLLSSGLDTFDALFHGGIHRNATTLFLGPSGSGKTVMATQMVQAASRREEHSLTCLFDERIQIFLSRSKGIGMDIEADYGCGLADIVQVNPSELTPGEFSHSIRRAVKERNLKLVVIDSLTGFANAMPDERQLVLHLRELLSFLNQKGVAVLLVMTQHGLPGISSHVPFDLSYLADSVLLFLQFEYRGEIRKALNVYKHRGGSHDRSIREFQIHSKGIRIGDPLEKFQGIISGSPNFLGEELPHVRNYDTS